MPRSQRSFRFLRAAAVAPMLWAAWVAPSFARDVHVAPISAQIAAEPNGSAARPWPSVEAALKSGGVEGGDTLLLAPGEYGHLEIRGARFKTPVVIASSAAGRAHALSLRARESRNLTFRDIDVWPLPGEKRRLLGYAGARTENIVFEGIDFRVAADAVNYRGWSKERWKETRLDGVQLRGQGGVLRGSSLTATGFAIHAFGPDTLIEGNLIDGFSGDGIRGLGQSSVYRRNTVRNCVKIDPNNHEDGFQSWSLGKDRRPGGGVLKDGVIDGNTIIEWDDESPPPFRCILQGISMFDGIYEGWTIQNNLVLTRHWHGITVFGARDLKILNNSVLQLDGKRDKRPWILVSKRKGGPGSRDVVVANNVTMALRLETDKDSPALSKTNLIAVYPRTEVDFSVRGSAMPKAGSRLIGAASPEWTPDHDHDGRPRPQGGAPDIGAFERPAP